MRDTFLIRPDRPLVDATLAAICNARSGKTGAPLGLEEAMEVLKDLYRFGWDVEAVEDVKETIRWAFAAISEAWKTIEELTSSCEAHGDDDAQEGGKRSEPSDGGVADRIFKRHGWNEVDSGFKFFSSP